MQRRPRVAGMFYPGSPSQLKDTLGTFFSRCARRGNAMGVVSPHAGYIYSGQIAAHAFSALPPDFRGTFIIIGPSHSGYSSCASAIPWETPLGTLEIDVEFIRALDLTIDEFSHRDEHSLEVQMPFIQYLYPEARVAPIMMGEQDLTSARHLAEKISRAIDSTGRNVRIIASSDFSHYIPDDVARKQDLFAIEALFDLDIEEFYQRIMEKGVSACGYGPIAVMALVCQKLGAEKAELLKYGTSGDVTGDQAQVVGYAAIAVI